MKKYLGLVIACVLGLYTWPSFGSDIKVEPSTLYPLQSSVIIQEEFISGGTTNGNVGANGFGVIAGGVSGVASIANRPGIMRLDTSAALTISRVTLYPGSNATIESNTPQEVLWIVRLNTNDANTTTRIGSMNSPGTDPPTRGLYIEKLGGDTNWFCVAREAGAETRTDSTVAVDTNFNKFFYRRSSAGVTYSINGVDVCGTITTNVPTNTFNPAVQIVNSVAASKTIDLDYFEMKYTGITR